MCVVLTQITRFLLGDLLTFFTLQACIFYIFYLFGMKMDKNFSCNRKLLLNFDIYLCDLGYFIWNSAWVFFF